MSRSYKKHSIGGITNARSEKQDKRLANRALRRITKQQIKQGVETLPLLREVSNIWAMDKDGKKYYDPLKYPDILRK